MPRIYTEIRISHKTHTEKIEFEKLIKQQADKLGLTTADYIRTIVKLDVAGYLIEKFKGVK